MMNRTDLNSFDALVLNASTYSSLSRHSVSILLNKLAFGLRNANSNPFHDYGIVSLAGECGKPPE
ncbi:MAG TPA: hypothetical protein VFG90_10635 [Nitrososphaeraceae archaeon]|nr:hypothetical protein [Nitrososphaeraceae archaeon]